MNLLNESKRTLAKALSAAGQTEVDSDAIDMANYENCLFLVSPTVIVTTGTGQAHVAECATSGGTYVDIADSKVSFVEGDAGALIAIEVKNPRKRYIRLEVLRNTANITLSPIIAIQYGPRKQQSIGALEKLVVSHAEGTP